MTNRDIFKIWAPIDAKWTDWVRPVPFVSINNGFEFHDYGNFKIEEIKYVSNLLLDTAIIVDMPTAKYFLDNGINKIIVRANSIQRDLKKILYKYQKNGIKIFFTNGYDEPKHVKIKKLFV